VEREIRWFAESAILVKPYAGEDVHHLARTLNGLEGVEEALPGARILVRPVVGHVEDVLEATASIPFYERGTESPSTEQSRTIEIPVCFDGPDLEDIAETTTLTVGQVASAVEHAELRVAYLGFAPGFSYIEGLASPLSGVPRRASPRTSVAAGSVAIAGGYIGIYPRSSPGGWNVIGRTNMSLFDPLVPPYATLQPGDKVRFAAVEELDSTFPASPSANRPRRSSGRFIVIEDPGVLTTLQDAGRVAMGRLGVPRAGPADADMMRVANLLVGNAPGAGVLESTISGPAVRFSSDGSSYAVVVGAAVEVDGRQVKPGAVFEVPAHGLVSVGASVGLRSYMACSGGITGPEMFGSCATDLLSGLGFGPLIRLDELGLGQPGRPRGYAAGIERHPTVRIVPGPDQFDRESLSRWTEEPFIVSTDSNRIGVRLERLERLEGHDGATIGEALTEVSVGSYGMIEGAVQIPPSGDPIVLLADHATMGGYPVCATVISSDLGAVAQARPGDEITFELVSLEEALEARSSLDRQISRAPTGYFPTGELF
jgi:KipI family sensor histidine kinase inhibitor